MNDMTGHNLPPQDEATFDQLTARTNALVEIAKKWAEERPEIADEDEATKGGDFLDQLRMQLKAIEAERKTIKQPHLDAAAAVDARYNPLKRPIEICADIIKTKLTAWLKKKDEEHRAKMLAAEQQRRAAEEAAKKAAAEAEQAQGAAAIDKQLAAEEAERKAQAAAREARQAAERPKVASAYGGRAKSLRPHTVVVIEDATKIPAKYLRMLCAKAYVTEALERAVKENPRAFQGVAGIKITEEKRAV